MDEIRIECPICLEPFEIPRGLPCLHNFCTKCLQWHIDHNSTGEQFACPICRSLTTLPNTSLQPSSLATGFPVANVVCDLMTVLRTQNKETNKSSVDDCEICLRQSNDLTEAIAFCKTCKLNFCANCSNAHSIEFPAHKLMLDKDSLVGTSRHLCDDDEYPMCPIHKNATLDLFCSSCDTFICLKCTYGKHAVCTKTYGNIKSIDVLTEEKMTTDQIQRIKFENGRDEMNQLLKNIEEAKTDLLLTKEKSASQIDETIDAMIASLEKKRTDGKVSLEKAYDTRLNTLLKSSSIAQKRLTGLIQHILSLEMNLEIKNKYEYICASKKSGFNKAVVDILLPEHFSVKSDLAFSMDPEFRLIFDKMQQLAIGNAFVVKGMDHEQMHWYKFETPEKLAVKIYPADIITTNVEGIVNPTDGCLPHSGKLSQHITQAAGPSVSAETVKFFKSRGQVALALSDTYITQAGKLDFKFIIHAVLPASEQDIIKCNGNKNLEKLISQTVSNTLCVANFLKFKSVALPPFCFSPAFAQSYAGGYLQGVLNFSKNHCVNSTNTLREVHFVDSNVHATHYIQDVFKKHLKIIYMST